MADNAERRLSELLRDPEWYLPPRPDVMVRIRSAARRQRVKAAGSAACAAAIASAAVAVPLTLSGTGAWTGTGTGTPAGTAHTAHASTPPASQAYRVMPMVVGMNEQEAKAIISAAIRGPHITIRYATGSEPAGTVLAQVPVAGSRVTSGSKITLVVCD